MKVNKIVQLFSAYGQSAESSQATSKTQADAAADQGRSEAVTISQGFGRGSEEAESAARSARVAELKSAVQSGSYNPDSQKVAESVARELFA